MTHLRHLTTNVPVTTDGDLPDDVDSLMCGKELVERSLLPTFEPLMRIKPWEAFSRFEAPAGAVPEDFFSPALTKSKFWQAPRYIRKTESDQFLIFTDGSCLKNGKGDAQAGCAFIYRPQVIPGIILTHNTEGYPLAAFQLHTLGCKFWRLENQGPDGTEARQTKDRAELRAVIGALQYRYWTGEGFRRLVIATDSKLVVYGATNWIIAWQGNQWKTNSGFNVPNADLWLELIKELNNWRSAGLEVSFWWIKRELNTLADQFSKEGALMEPQGKWTEIHGILY